MALAGAWRRLQGRHRAPGRAARVELGVPLAAGVVAAPLILIYVQYCIGYLILEGENDGPVLPTLRARMPKASFGARVPS